MLLKDKVAVITGAASGIGKATALLFAREGAHAVCIDIRDGEGRETVASMRRENLQASYIHADVADSSQVRRAARECEKIADKVDILFNNAGRSFPQRFEETTEQTWSEMIGIHLTGTFHCSKHFLPLMTRSGSASIINHASVDALLGNPSLAAYSAGKGGLIPLTHVMAHDLAKYNIRVNSLCSGGILTPAIATPGKAGANQARIAVTPMQRQGRPEEVAYAALFFALPWASFVNGANLVVDGGRTGITQGCF